MLDPEPARPRQSAPPRSRTSLRRAVLFFAIGSALYWRVLTPVLTVLLVYAVGIPPRNELGDVIIFLISLVPMLLYAPICYAFIRWALKRYRTELEPGGAATLDTGGFPRT